MWRVIRISILLVLSGIWAAVPDLFADVPALSADAAKAGILSKIPDYVKWPSKPKDGRFVFGVLGDKRIQGLLETLLKGVEIEGLPVEIRSVENSAEINQCQILFVPLKRNDDWLAMDGAVVRTGLLTMGESNNFLEKGGVVRIETLEQGPKSKLEVHLRNSENAGLKINPQLFRLRLAKAVR
jgi:hypothetical protein